ncbi:cytochrome P450 [Obba rivulosa]|uniref:Cytochrome P450 n=1 Tax=Obba rivulosa TaxID=1052685 RepID=A0A8E2AN06_9APHY|nr:cytochrome P450 [Obba rivulosa]
MLGPAASVAALRSPQDVVHQLRSKMQVLGVVILVTFAVISVVILHRFFARKTFEHIRGPSSTSWLFGNILEFNRQDQAGDLDFKWCREFGSTWRLNGILGESILMTADPEALRHIFHKSGYSYRKTANDTEVFRIFSGPSIIWASGHVHQRHRKVISPAFSAPQLHTFIPLFQRNIRKVTKIWRNELASRPEGRMVDCVHVWLTKVTLDIIGEAAFDYSFGAMSNAGSRLLDVYTNMFLETSLHPPKLDLLIKASWEYFPVHVLRLVDYLPLKDVMRINQVRKAFHGEAQKLLKDKTKRLMAGEEGKKDIMSVLVRANASEDARARLSNAEMIAQMGTITIAGHDTTATTLTWLLYELSKNPDYQIKMREEIRMIRSSVTARGDTNFSAEDLDAMKYCMAALKETLRYHAIVLGLPRVAEKDDVIPLQYPVVSKSGELIREIPIRAGQQILTSFCAYNRLPRVWGDNADVWDPTRFLDHDVKRETSVGMFSNLMTFSAGVRGCIGWRFSVMESQALIAEILENFEFSPPPNPPEILRLPSSVMAPAVRGEKGIQMPLQISIVE